MNNAKNENSSSFERKNERTHQRKYHRFPIGDYDMGKTQNGTLWSRLIEKVVRAFQWRRLPKEPHVHNGFIGSSISISCACFVRCCFVLEGHTQSNFYYMHFRWGNFSLCGGASLLDRDFFSWIVWVRIRKCEWKK